VDGIERQREISDTDPQAEQGLEVECRWGCHALRCVVSNQRRNGEEATVAVMRCGCEWGNFFEGCEGAARRLCSHRMKASDPRVVGHKR